MTALRRLAAGIGSAMLARSALAAGALVGAAPAEATALPIQQCTTTSGAVLAVDFGHWGGPVVRACGSTPTTGYTLLNQGGWHSTGTHHDGPGFVCRISFSGYQGGAVFPTMAEQDCVNTPPTTAYWSYWHADPGQSGWTYSQDGAQSYSPHPGSVDLWTFGGSSGSPRVSPDSVRAHNSSPGLPNSAPASHTAPAGGSRSAGGSGSSTAAGGYSAGGGTATQGAPGGPVTTGGSGQAGPNHNAPRSSASASSSGAASAGLPASSDSAAPSIVNAEPAAAVRHSSGSVLPGLITAGLVLALGSIAALTGWRRRQAR
jgi:hypothetical protein